MTERNVPFFNYPALFAERGDEYADTLREVMSRGAYIMQKDLIQFEEELADFLGAKHVIGVADGTVPLTLSLNAPGTGAGDQGIGSGPPFVASAAAGRPVGPVQKIA